MEKLNSDDIALLFKNLVLMPEPTTIEIIKETEEISKTTEPIVENSKIELNEVAEEPTAEYTIKSHPFTIYIPEAIKEFYLKPDSSFIKIINALEVPQLAKYLNTTIPENPKQYNCLWCIGMDIENEKSLIKANHKNILFSPNLLTLKSNEEKKAMYVPLKTFINSNLDLISLL